MVSKCCWLGTNTNSCLSIRSAVNSQQQLLDPAMIAAYSFASLGTINYLVRSSASLRVAEKESFAGRIFGTHMRARCKATCARWRRTSWRVSLHVQMGEYGPIAESRSTVEWWYAYGMGLRYETH